VQRIYIISWVTICDGWVFLSLVSEACFVLYSTHYDEKRLKSMVDSSQEFPGEKTMSFQD
jgi:hypothetical protein